ncbi:MAG: lipopolysaccharide biosynthesis protein [Anaerolineae bacterium]|nr:lipopolysaccharide biosynthesis protein [Anaerolineae bacterium]
MTNSLHPNGPLTRVTTFHSTLWAAFGAVGRYLIAGITTLTLTHLLDPQHFGLVAITVLAQLIIEHILPVGFHDALIQRPTLDDATLNSAFWSALAIAIAALLSVIILAVPLADAFDQPLLAPLLIAMSAAALLRSISTVPRALLSRRLDFRTLALARIAGMLVAGTGAVMFAALGAGAWSLIAQVALLNGIGALIVFRVTRWRPRRTISRPALTSLWQFAPSVAVFTILSTLITHADDQIIGYRLGTQALGYYTLAYAFMAWPVYDVLGRVSAVLYPVFARLQNNPARLRTAYLESLQLATLCAFPLLTLIVITAPVLVPWLLGVTWEPIVIPTQLLTLGGLRAATGMLNGSVYRALGKPHLHTLLELASAPCYLVAFLIGVAHGIAGVALLTLLTGILLQPLSWWLLCRVTGLTLRQWFSTLAPAAVGALLIAGVAIPLLHYTLVWNVQNAIARLLLVSVGSGLVYMAWLWHVRPLALEQLLSTIRVWFAPSYTAK